MKYYNGRKMNDNFINYILKIDIIYIKMNQPPLSVDSS